MIASFTSLGCPRTGRSRPPDNSRSEKAKEGAAQRAGSHESIV